MPIYEYQCDGCQAVFEVRQKISDPAPAKHSCGSTQIKRILSNTSFVLKGTGWYATDYAKPGARIDSDAPKETTKGADAAKEGAKKGAGTAPAPASASSDTAPKKPAPAGPSKGGGGPAAA